MPAKDGIVHQTLVSVSGSGPIRKCHRYLRVIDPKRRVWFHAVSEQACHLEREDGTAIRPFRIAVPGGTSDACVEGVTV